ncbi:DUF3114 domain-containing protein [Streptococcus castoreus]|uniref:DUF3114 domain-containing protein n=1 Tax=Streptococcus castoreus TaxID=254786 RepID=UPI000406177F|nr:DUF3114 domain-containing protein [Streptococcus castoreus]
MKQAVLARYQALKAYQKLGVSKQAFQALIACPVVDCRIGSKSFWRVWQVEKPLKSPKVLLTFLLNMVAMPLELSGDLYDTQGLLEHFHPDLAPDHPFWKTFAQLVDRAFPDKQLSESGNLEKRLHQFRYLISSQQAQYIRKQYKKVGMTDGQALALFLRSKKGPTFWRKSPDYTLMGSARLHNKLKFEDNQVVFPDQEVSYNIKVLLWFHTEFILDKKGFFLNEIDGELVTERGIINGASFNYGTDGQRHWDLDVTPIARHDPEFRKVIMRGYRSPRYILRRWFQKPKDDFVFSYFNPKGSYSSKNKSCFSLVKKEVKKFKRQIKKSF